MSRWVRVMLSASVLLVGTSGIAYFWMKYVLESADPFSVVNHPLQPWMLTLHLLASPLLVLVLGIIMEGHMRTRVAQPQNRWSGLLSFLLLLVATASGYLLQVTTDALIARALVWAHLLSGGVFLLFYAAHLIVGRRLAAAAEAAEAAAAGTP